MIVKSSFLNSVTRTTFKARKLMLQSKEAISDIRKRTFRYLGSNLLLQTKYPLNMT